MKKILSLLTLLVAVVTGAWADTELVNIDFSDETGPYSAGQTYTIDGTSVYFKSAASISDNTLLFGGNASTSQHFIAIPLSDINGEITITVTYPSARPQWKHYFNPLDAEPTASNLSSNPSSMSDNTRPGSNTTTSSWTISNINKSYGVFYIGAGSNNSNKKLSSIIITTPSGGGSGEGGGEDDTTAPTLTSSTPADNATRIATAVDVTFTFDEDIVLTDDAFSLSPSATKADAVVSGRTVHVLLSKLGYNRTYTLSLAANKITDAAGNAYASELSKSFTTVAAPSATKTWDFAADYSTELATMASDGTNWKSNSGGYKNNTTINYETLKIGDNVFSVTKGLKFHSSATERMLIRSGNNIQINTQVFISIPNLKRGWTVECVYQPGGNTGQRWLGASNLNIIQAFSDPGTDGSGSPITVQQIGLGTVKVDGPVVLWAENNNVNITSITVKDEEGNVVSADELVELANQANPAAPRNWDYTSISTTDNTNLAADATNWTNASGEYKSKFTASKDAPLLLEANGNQLEKFPGFQVYRKASALGADGFRILKTKFHLNGNTFGVIIPNIHKGDKIKIDYSSTGASNTTNLFVYGVATATDSQTGTTSKTATTTVATENGEIVIETTNKATYIYGIRVIPSVDAATVQSYGWATYIPANDVSFEEAAAYVVTDVNTSTGAVTVDNVTSVPAGTPVLLKGAGLKTMTVLAETPDAPAENMLSVSDGTDVDGKYPYVLAKNGESAGFKKWTGAVATLNNRVVLWLDSEVAAAREFFSFDEDGITTGIRSIDNGPLTKDHGNVYNLNGQRVTAPAKGLYIINGKKVVVK